MTITLSQQGFDELFQETVERSQHPDPDDVMDVVYKYPRRLGQGYWRRIELRQRLGLIIGNLQMRNRMIILQPEQEHDWLEYHFHFSGEHHDKYRTVGAGEYSFVGSGLDPKQTNFGGRRRSTANVEQVEVLKDPASVLYGQGEPGGIINVVTKKPLFDPLYGVELTVGNFDFYRPTIDLTGPLNTDKTIRYRLNADYLTSNSFVDFSDREQFTVNPVITFDIGKNTTFTIEGEYSKEVATANASLPAAGTILDNPLGRVPRSRFLFYPDLPPQDRRFSSVGYSLQHKFSDRWQIRNSFRASFEQISESYNFLSLRADNEI